MNNKQIKMPLQDDTSVIRFGLTVIFVVFVVLGAWAAFAPLATSSVASGKVSADLGKKTIQHLEGGIIESIFVKDGDKVKKDQILMKLSDVQVKAQLNILRAQYQDGIAQLARLKAQRDGLKHVEFPKNLTDADAIKNQTNIFVSTNKSIEDEAVIASKRVLQLQSQISGTTSLIESKQNRLVSIAEEVSEWEDLYKQRLVDKQKIRDLQRESNMVGGDLANAKSEIAKLKEQINEVSTQKLLKEKQFQNDTLQKYVETETRISDLKSKIIANEDTLSRSSIVSPIDGTIVGLSSHTVGGVISPSKPILEIIPEDAKLLVIAHVSTVDIDKVVVGLKAEIKFSAFNLRQVLATEGKVIHVSADIFTDEATHTPYYEAKIEVTKEGQKILEDHGFVLVSGMPAEVMINIGDRTALNYMIKPFREMLGRSFNEE
ncbi:MAG: HlyD family type I secretion periplasmic adaptor subunit [Campylobacterales bacterium]|nr:HlyD family type I secretion periplasmic adaptor subunit [Campylobacterales bacterium]